MAISNNMNPLNEIKGVFNQLRYFNFSCGFKFIFYEGKVCSIAISP